MKDDEETHLARMLAAYPPSSEGGSVEGLVLVSVLVREACYPPSSEGGSVEGSSTAPQIPSRSPPIPPPRRGAPLKGQWLVIACSK